MVAYSNVRRFQQYGTILGSQPNLHLHIQADFIIFEVNTTLYYMYIYSIFYILNDLVFVLSAPFRFLVYGIPYVYNYMKAVLIWDMKDP